MGLSIYCSNCDKQIEITKHTVYSKEDIVYVECDYCDDKEEVQ